MSGVIDKDGTQWEHCNGCGKMVRLEDLGYAPPTAKHKHGQDLCLSCVNKLSQSAMRRVKPAAGWTKQYN